MPTDTESPPARFWTVEDVSRIANVHQRTVRRWIAEGRIPAPRKIGQKFLWPRDIIEAFFRNEGIA